MKNKYKKILLLFIILVAVCFVVNNVNAAITINDNGNESSVSDSRNNNVLEEFADTATAGIQKLVEILAGAAASGVFATITALINALTLAMFIILNTFFGLTIAKGTELFMLPMPDSIVFNRFAFFDANFVNPSNYSLTGAMETVLSNLFASFQTVAIAIFIVAAMITGLKMALSSIASKKAQYKETALKWVTGFLILICLKWILAGIFYINEYIVALLYSVASKSELSIPVYVTEAIPIFGSALTELFKGVASLWGGDGGFNVKGYFGIFLSNLTRSIGGDITASIVGFIIIGQTLTVIGSYIKRVFMCILLGIVSPLIVAADTITASTGKQSTIFKNWLQNFSVTVFMQSIHAAYMVVVLQILAKLYAQSTWSIYNLNAMQVGIVTIVLTTGLVKLEKLIKSLFGIGDSLAGSLKDGGKGMLKALGAVKGLEVAGKAIKDNAPKMRDAAKRRQASAKTLDTLKAQKRSSNDTYQQAMSAARDAKHRGDTAEYSRQMKIAMQARREGVYGKEGTNVKQGNNLGDKQDVVQQAINKASSPITSNTQNKNMTIGEQIRQAEEEHAKSITDFKSAALASTMSVANIAAGAGIGLGLDDDLVDVLTKGSVITKGLDWATEKVGAKAADKDRKTFYEHEKQDGERLGYTPSEKIIREKTVVEKTIDNAIDKKLYIDPVAVGKEIAKKFEGIGDVFSDTMKRELRHIDRDIDNQ